MAKSLRIDRSGSTSGIFRLGAGGKRIFEMPAESARMFFIQKAIVEHDMAANELGLYTMLRMGRDGKAKIGSLRGARHLIRPRTSCDEWDPAGRTWFKSREVSLKPLEIMMEQCPDAMFDSCWEMLLGKGNDIRNLLATKEGRQLWKAFIDEIYLGIGNSFADLMNYGGHDIITDANTNSLWDQGAMSLEEWKDYHKQQIDCDINGWFTQIDQSNQPHLNVQIHDNEFEGPEYTGDVAALVDRADAAGTSYYKKGIKGRRNIGAQMIRLATPAIYDKIEQLVIDSADGTEMAYKLMVNGMPQDGVTKYKGKWVICDDSTDSAAQMSGKIIHRLTTMQAGNFGIAFDAKKLNHTKGMGLRIEQDLDLPAKGKIYMHSDFKARPVIIDHEMMTSAQVILSIEK